MGEITRGRNARIRVHVVAVIHRAERFPEERRERFVEVLRIAPGGEGRILTQRATSDLLLRMHGSLGVHDSERRETDARQEDDERNAKSEGRGKVQQARTRPENTRTAGTRAPAVL